jgi:enoyl-CoA hydratase
MPKVLAEERGDVLVVTINRPDRRNAVDRETAEGIAGALDRLDGDDAYRVGVLTGAGGTFCAGMDLAAFAAGELPHVEGRGFAGIVQAPPRKPLIAAVEGYAVAGGLEVMLACDLTLAAEDARFGLPEVRRGLVAAGGGLFRSARRIGRAATLELALTGELIDGARALSVGLVTRLVAPGASLAAAVALAEAIARNAPLAVAATKEIVDAVDGCRDDEAWEVQRPLVERVRGSDDAREGARAFTEKRAPRWTGR